MSATLFNQETSSPSVIRRTPMSNEDTSNNSQRAANRRSLSDKIRNLFRKDSTSPNRSASNDRRPVTKPARQTSPSPEAPGLQAPTVHWPFSKKKAKVAATTSTSTTNKKKTKDGRKTKQTPTTSMEISSPIYVQDNRTAIYGQNFVPRTPELVYGSYEGIQTSTNYDGTTTKGPRNYTVVDETRQYQQVVAPDVDVFIPSTYTSNRSPSPPMNRQRLPNSNSEYRYQNDSVMPSIKIPLADVEVMNTPQRKRKVGDTPPLMNTQRLADKPPVFPQTSSRPPSTIQPSNLTSNPTQWNSMSSSTYNNNMDTRAARPTSKDNDVPKLNAPSISLSSAPNKKKTKRTKSQSRADEINASSSTISNLVRINPVQPNRAWSSTYGSLPDAEIIPDNGFNSFKPSKSTSNKYPGLSAIVGHHMRPAPIYHREIPPITTTTTTTITATATPQRRRRFETSTTTLNEYGQNEPWTQTTAKDTSTSTSNLQRYDGYIRPMSPQQPIVSVDISVMQLDADDLRGVPSPSSVRPLRYESPERPGTYRSSKTIYTRDRQHVGSGEIRTWSSQDVNTNDNRPDMYKKPYSFVEAERTSEKRKDEYEHQVVPPEKKTNFDEYRYSPRAHEQNLYEKQQQILDDNDHEMEEERYEVSYVYDNQNQSAYEAKKYYLESQSANQYSHDIGSINNLVSSNPIAIIQSSPIPERGQAYEQSPRSFMSNEYAQEFLLKAAPVENSKQIPYTCTLKRTDSYDGLGILISTDTERRANHFIREVEPNSPGHRAGLRPNDRIISINGVNIENADFNNVLILIKQGLNNDNLQFSVMHELDFI
ncbi:unnamed protein product [Rotaria magnacalcarata]|uniref:PDZ domain-containing protein n=2 Tax=Rotaria magnacalcarata TaxID=392030 RepID=A0A818XL72_9BILA|nr:unnamed protein product [Rotaria magnacalcarata]CAF2143952.1 unnamed protein product [Rotaria magnacalcarata]CAF3740765.1 unnamed protein product [Rotaria magnacalcarata]CAF3742140.1 unnamed protein product [Rotaria magnacalcarata]